MKRVLSESQLARLRSFCRTQPCLSAVYVFEFDPRGDFRLAALFPETPSWPERLDLELAMSKAMELENVELIDLRRMPLVFRFDVINRGELVYVGQPEPLATFIEHTIARYSAFYPLLEALYWRVETKPLAEDML
jgi:hypothetical protein